MEEGEQEQPEWSVGPEDEYDALNDETFGGGGEEYTWESSQTLLFDDIAKSPINLTHSNSSSNGYSKPSAPPEDNIETVVAKETPKETEYYDYENDNALEESISRLVLDDMEDTEDEEEARKLKLSRLGATSNFSTYFMPPQVATKHLHWLMDKELPGGSSLLGSSVWSMHPTNLDDSNNVASTPPFRNIQPAVVNSTIKQSLRSNYMPSDEMLVDGENNVSKFVGGMQSSTPINSASSKKPVFKTVEEIERELLEEGNKNASSPKLAEEPVINHSKPKVLMAEDLERALIQESPLATPTQRSQEVDNRGRSPLRNMSQFNQLLNQDASFHTQGQQKQAQAQHPPVMGQQQQSNVASLGPQHPINFNNLPGTPPGMNANAAVNNFMMMEQQKQMLLARQGLLPAPPHPAMHPGIVPGGPIPPQLLQGFHPGMSPLQQQHHIRMLQMNPQLRGRLPLIMPMTAVMPPHLRPHVLSQAGYPSPQNVGPGYRKQQFKTDDPYRGLMTEKDKQRLRNIQIIQLQNDHPFTTDYYNLMHKAKQAAPGGLQLLTKLYPKRDDGSTQKSQYEPARFENCLGKLQAVSALAPKRVIDTFIRVTESRTASKTGVKAFRYLLLEIEKLYECLLVLEESDIRVSILCNAAENDILRRSQNAAKVARILTTNDKFISIIGVPKGKMLICRALPLIDPAIRYKVLGHLLDIFPLWGHDDMDKAFPYLRHCILHAEIRDLLTILGGVTDNVMFESIVITQIGISVLTCLFHQAEQMLSHCDTMLAEDIESHWTLKSSFAISAILLKSDEIANPLEFYPNFLKHIRRFALHSNDVQALETMAQRWANAGIPARIMTSA